MRCREELALQPFGLDVYSVTIVERFRRTPRILLGVFAHAPDGSRGEMLEVPDPDGQRRAEAAIAAQDARKAERHRLEMLFGKPEATRRANEVQEELDAALNRIADAPAPRTLLGFAAKARVALSRDERAMSGVLCELLAASGLVEAAPELDEREEDEAEATADDACIEDAA